MNGQDEAWRGAQATFHLEQIVAAVICQFGFFEEGGALSCSMCAQVF